MGRAAFSRLIIGPVCLRLNLVQLLQYQRQQLTSGTDLCERVWLLANKSWWDVAQDSPQRHIIDPHQCLAPITGEKSITPPKEFRICGFVAGALNSSALATNPRPESTNPNLTGDARPLSQYSRGRRLYRETAGVSKWEG